MVSANVLSWEQRSSRLKVSSKNVTTAQQKCGVEPQAQPSPLGHLARAEQAGAKIAGKRSRSYQKALLHHVWRGCYGGCRPLSCQKYYEPLKVEEEEYHTYRKRAAKDINSLHREYGRLQQEALIKQQQADKAIGEPSMSS
jgi:hypothetical protein